MKNAPKMTNADELYLKKFMEGRKFAQLSKVEEFDDEKQQRANGGKEPFDDDKSKVNITINTRLHEERRKMQKEGL